MSSPGGEEGSREGGRAEGEGSAVGVVGEGSASDGEAVLKKGRVREGVVREEVIMVRVIECSPPRMGSSVVVAKVVYTKPGGGTTGSSVWAGSKGLGSDSRMVVGETNSVVVRSPFRSSRMSKVLVVVSSCVGLVNLGLESGRVGRGGSWGKG